MDGGSLHCTGERNQDHPQEKEMQKSKMLSKEALQITCEKKGSKKQRRKRKIYPVAITEFSKFAGLLSAALSQYHLPGFEIAQLEFHHLH